MPDPLIDFRELAQHGQPGEGLEMLVEQLAIRARLSPVWSGRGPDRGRDLLFTEDYLGVIARPQIKWLVSCKDHAEGGESVPPREVSDIVNQCAIHKVRGFLLVTTTVPSTNAKASIDAHDVQNGGSLFTSVWNKGHLYDLLTKSQNLDIFRQFLPASFARYMASSSLQVLIEAFRTAMPADELAKIVAALAPYEAARLLADQLPGDETAKARFDSAVRSFMREGVIQPLALATSSLATESMPLVFQFLEKHMDDYMAIVFEMLKSIDDAALRPDVFKAAKGVTEDSFADWAEVASALQPQDIYSIFEDELFKDVEELLRGGCEPIETDLNGLGRSYDYDVLVESVTVSVCNEEGIEIQGSGQIRVEGSLDVSVNCYLDDEEEVSHSASLSGSFEAYYECGRLVLGSASISTDDFWTDGDAGEL